MMCVWFFLLIKRLTFHILQITHRVFLDLIMVVVAERKSEMCKFFELVASFLVVWGLLRLLYALSASFLDPEEDQTELKLCLAESLGILDNL